VKKIQPGVAGLKLGPLRQVDMQGKPVRGAGS
jgi:hypothetical protein